MPDPSANPFSLAGRVALVTGSSTGLGKAMAIALGKAGAKVALNYANNTARAKKSFAEFQALGLTGALFKADVTSEADVTKMHRAITKQLGPVDIIVLNLRPAAEAHRGLRLGFLPADD